MKAKNTKFSLIKRSFRPPSKGSYFLFGPRGTGKSRLLKAYYDKAIFIDLLDDQTQLSFAHTSEKLEAVVRGIKEGDTLVIDEIQKAPHLLQKVHQIMEDDTFPNIQFVLTGSSARKLKRVGTDLLAGRALVKTLHPFLASELKSKFNLETSLNFGLLPVIFNSIDPKSALTSYITTYLREEVKQEGLVRNLEAFSRFLEIMSFSHGEILNLSNVARESAIRRSTVDGYLEILEDLLLGYRIEVFKKRNRKNTIGSSKFYYFDVGIYRTLRPSGYLDSAKDSIGAALEGLVLQNLLAWTAYRNKNESIFYWRTEAGTEVDFVIYGPKTFVAIEVKNSKNIKNEFLNGLRSFKEDYPEATCVLLYRGTHKEVHHNIECIPVKDYLMALTID